MRLSEATMRRLVADARVARLATIDPDGTPNVVPICYALEGTTLFSGVDQKPKSTTRLRRLRNIERDPRVMLLADHYEEQWDRVWWVRLRGTGRLLSGAEAETGIRLLVEKYPQYALDPPQGAVLAIEAERWVGWSMAPLE